MAVDNPDELRRLRRELQSRMEFRPARYWSARLLSALIAVFDMEFGHPDLGNGGKPRLSVVRDTVQA